MTNEYEVDESGYQDFFSPYIDYKDFLLPDGKQSIRFKVMSEGERMRYQKKTNRPINIDRRSDTASISPDVASDRLELIITSVVDWTLVSRGPEGNWVMQPYSESSLRNWVLTANPKIISDLERAIQKANPWMQAEMSEKDIEDEIENLQQLLEQKRKEELEKNS